MYQPSFLGIVAAPSRKVPELRLDAAAFGAHLLIAFALPSHVLAHEAHPPAQPARAAALDPTNSEGSPPPHKGPWPLCNGFNYQPTEQELRALHQEDVTPHQAREIDRLYDQLLGSSDHQARQNEISRGRATQKLSIFILNLLSRSSKRPISCHKSRQHRSNERVQLNRTTTHTF
jgi:hypothetical protein